MRGFLLAVGAIVVAGMIALGVRKYIELTMNVTEDEETEQ